MPVDLFLGEVLHCTHAIRLLRIAALRILPVLRIHWHSLHRREYNAALHPKKDNVAYRLVA